MAAVAAWQAFLADVQRCTQADAAGAPGMLARRKMAAALARVRAEYFHAAPDGGAFNLLIEASAEWAGRSDDAARARLSPVLFDLAAAAGNAAPQRAAAS